jgi:hypothetical protein|tara:strand:+ start:349 stop:543 length:195 start_codon:yes stop_codon:yes gene_type:complete
MIDLLVLNQANILVARIGSDAKVKSVDSLFLTFQNLHEIELIISQQAGDAVPLVSFDGFREDVV